MLDSKLSGICPVRLHGTRNAAGASGQQNK